MGAGLEHFGDDMESLGAILDPLELWVFWGQAETSNTLVWGFTLISMERVHWMDPYGLE